MKKIQISPSILSADFSQLGNEIKRLEEGGADMIHVDVMDGHFVPNLTVGPPVIKALRKQCSIKFDVHLMISPVHKYIEAYADAGADIITIHPEATENLEESITKIKSLNKKVGISLNPESKLDLITNYLEKIDLVLLMSANNPIAVRIPTTKIIMRYLEYSIPKGKLRVPDRISGTSKNRGKAPKIQRIASEKSKINAKVART